MPKSSEKQYKLELLEYYDLPNKYKETFIKLLAQTPKTLFVYWNISDEDIEKYLNLYGKHLLKNTKPILILHNISTNQTYEVDINDIATNWYLTVENSNCDFEIKLARKPINSKIKFENDFLYLATSNITQTPNDHILLENHSNLIKFKNIKTEKFEIKNIEADTKNEIYNIYKFYKELYKDASINNPSSNFNI